MSPLPEGLVLRQAVESLPHPGLGTKVRAGQDPGGRAAGAAEVSVAEG